MSNRQDLDNIVFLYKEARIIGFGEARGLLELVLEGFSSVRDRELDQYMTMLEQRENEDTTKEVEENPPEVPE